MANESVENRIFNMKNILILKQKLYQKELELKAIKMNDLQNNQKSVATPMGYDTLLVAGLVTVLQTPITERYCKVGDTATLDLNNKQIRCGGVWFKFDERWIVQPCN